jgi:hypothetical protein
MRILELYSDFHIDHATEGYKHCRPGWVNVPCPFCTGNEGMHLGYNMEEDYYNCWRCGGKFPDKVIARLLTISIPEARKLIKQYGGTSHRSRKEPKAKINLTPFKYPSGEIKLKSNHKRYLVGRGFDPEHLEAVWGVSGTGPVAYLDGTNYSHRILAPITWGGREVSFQTRHMKSTPEFKYLACPMAREIIHHQRILYGKPLEWGRRGVCVEGITDVWRLGVRSFAVFGIDYTPYQAEEIKRHFDEVIILFDPDPQARKQAEKLRDKLEYYRLKCHIEDIQQDPGSMSQDDANHLMKQLL